MEEPAITSTAREKEEQLVNNVARQLEEIEILSAMFPGKDEIVWADPSLLIDAQDYCASNGTSTTKPQSLSFEMNVSCNDNTEEMIKIFFKLPLTYPDETRPEVVVSLDFLSRTNLASLKLNMNSFISALDFNKPIILTIILWLKENIPLHDSHESKEESCIGESSDLLVEELTSMWLYMHHIYNKHKRKDILNWSHDFSLTGFCLPGKPGVVYIEGRTPNVEAYFEKLRALPWKSIKCRHREVSLDRKFKSFDELSFDPHGTRSNHMDFGMFYQFLLKNDLGHMFKEIFGIHGQLKQE